MSKIGIVDTWDEHDAIVLVFDDPNRAIDTVCVMESMSPARFHLLRLTDDHLVEVSTHEEIEDYLIIRGNEL